MKMLRESHNNEERGGEVYQRTKEKKLGELRALAKNKPEWRVFESNVYQFLLREGQTLYIRIFNEYYSSI